MEQNIPTSYFSEFLYELFYVKKIGWMTLVMKFLNLLKHILTHIILVVPEKQFSYLKNCLK